MDYSFENYISSTLKASFLQDCQILFLIWPPALLEVVRLILGFCLHIFTNHGSNALKTKSHVCTKLMQTVLTVLYFVLFLN